MPNAQFLHHPVGHTIGGTTVFHDLAKHGTQQEDNKPVLKKSGEAQHVAGGQALRSFGCQGRHEGNTTGNGHQQGAKGCGQQDIHTTDCQHDQQGQAADEPNHT